MRVALQSDYDGGTLFQSHQRLRTWSESNSFSERAEKALKALREQRVVSEHICCNAAGSPLNGNKFNKHLKKVTEAVGIPYLSSHKTGFWSVTALAKTTGEDIQKVMYAAGHVDKNTTLHSALYQSGLE